LATLFTSVGFAVVFSLVFLVVNLLNKAITVHSCGNGFNVVVMAVSAAEQHSNFEKK
jgi:hypothetical protein